MKTRSQARCEQSSHHVACPGDVLNVRPRGSVSPHQGHYDAVVADFRQRISGSQNEAANGGSGQNSPNSNPNPNVNNVNNVNVCTDSDFILCKDPRCKTCPQLVKSFKVKSTNTGREYECNFKTDQTAFCHYKNLIYLLSCNNCKIQYVGQTGQTLKRRINGHRTSQIGKGCKLFSEHMKSMQWFRFYCSNSSYLLRKREACYRRGRSSPDS